MKKIFRYWLPLAFGLTIVCGLIHVAVQQDIRQNANDPQIQMAEDTASLLGSGIAPKSLVNESVRIDMPYSLSPYLTILDDKANVIVSNALLNGGVPVPPNGVLQYAKDRGENRITWEPVPGVRSAIVVVPYGGDKPGFVIAGRSLREVEVREALLTMQTGFGWIAALIGTLAIAIFMHFLANRKVSAE